MGLIENWNWGTDGWIVAAGALCAVAASLLGNFMVLRRMSMLGDAISHAVLPGLAAAFFLSGSRSSIPMFLGAVIVGVLTALFTEWIRRAGRVNEGASMGVVFTSLFALGLVMIVQAADHVDLDPGCVLYGAIELTPLDQVSVFGLTMPRAVWMLAIVTVVNAAYVMLFFKELKICSFDPALATTTGFNSSLIHYTLMVLVAVTAVASFETVGNILVVAMFVVPPAAAYMLTDRLKPMIIISVVIAVVSAVLGHIGAIAIPQYFGYQSTSTSGMMAVAVGVILFFALILGPRHGVLSKLIRRMVLSLQILSEDVIALLYRIDERGRRTIPSFDNIRELLLSDRLTLRMVLWWLGHRKEITQSEGAFELTDNGRQRAKELVRSHRLWEKYLVAEAGIGPDRIHQKAERFEHFTDRELRKRLDEETNAPTLDPHGSPIPDEK